MQGDPGAEATTGIKGHFNLESPGLSCLCLGSWAWEGSRNRHRGVSHRKLLIIRMDWPHDLEKTTEKKKLSSSHFFFFTNLSSSFMGEMEREWRIVP